MFSNAKISLLTLVFFLSGCGGGVMPNFKNQIKTNFIEMRTTLPAKHLKVYLLPVVDLRIDKTNLVSTETVHSIWGPVKHEFNSDVSPVEIINEKLTEYFNSLGIFWVEKNKAHAFLKLSLKKFQSNLNVHPFQNHILDSEVEFDIEIIRVKGGGLFI
jgi:hypothetical protein